MTPDSIVREIHIHAGIDRVWGLVTKSGWWIGDEPVWTFDAVVGETVTIETEKWGNFDVRTEQLNPKTLAVYRWAPAFAGAALTMENTTLIAFTLEEQADGVAVQVKETGFSALPGDDDFRRKNYEDNIEGWGIMLGLLKRDSEA